MSYRAMHFVKTVLQTKFVNKTCKIKQFHMFRTLNVQFSSKVQTKSDNEKFRTETNLVFPSDPDTFGTLAGRSLPKLPEDEGDLKEEEYLQNIPLRSQQLSTKQYADLIKQYVKHKRIKEALDVLEIKMIKEDRVKPENYIYNILIGACAEVGYTHKAFKLYNDMKRRALKVTGDTYTCLFNACANSPWPANGIKNAKHLREFMKEKGIEPNLTNYNSMIKAFGRCGDLSTSFQIIDEMVSKKIKIRVHTFNFLLQACISDKENGLRHAIIVWRKMLLRREKPNIYSFNLMLKCVKECNFGTQEDIIEALSILSQNIAISKAFEETPTKIGKKTADVIPLIECDTKFNENLNTEVTTEHNPNLNTLQLVNENENALTLPTAIVHSIPNLLSKNIQINEVVSIKEVRTPQDRFEFIGGQSGFLQEMKAYNVNPDFKTMAQMVFLIPGTAEAEQKLLETIREHGVWVDIEFYNTLIRKRCLRFDYEGALAVKTLIEKENRYRKKKHPMRKKLILKHNLLTYGALAMTCKTKEDAIKMIGEMEEQQIKINIEILGSMLSQAKSQVDFDYATYVMEHTKSLALKPNEIFLSHLAKISLRGRALKQQREEGTGNWTQENVNEYMKFCKYHRRWLKEIAELDSSKLTAEGFKLKIEHDHPWWQFKENQPETVQRQNLIKPPRRYFKRKKHPRTYKP